MNILLDTCAILFLSTGDPCVTSSVRKALDHANSVCVSPISAAELACLQERKRIALPTHWKIWFRQAVYHNAWHVIDISMAIAEEAYSLPDTFHPDPADRILTATARLHNLRLLTTDRKILDYPHVTSSW